MEDGLKSVSKEEMNISLVRTQSGLRTVSPSFDMTAQQQTVVRRVNMINERISAINKRTSVIIYGQADHASYLLRYTEMSSLNIIGIYEQHPNNVELVVDYKGIHRYKITNDMEILTGADTIILSFYGDQVRAKITELNKLGYHGKLVCIYSDFDIMPFYCVPKVGMQDENEQQHRLSPVEIVDEYYLRIIDRIQKVNRIIDSIDDNERVLIYAMGEHTEFLLEYTNINKKNIVGYADKKVEYYRGMRIRTVEFDSFIDIDKIVISSFRYQQNIADSLSSIGLSEKLVLLYDNDDKHEFYKNPNDYSPDYYNTVRETLKYSLPEIKTELERLSQELTDNSDYYASFSVSAQNISDLHIHQTDDIKLKSIVKKYNLANSQTAIILQGPIAYKNDFTYNTMKRYMLSFPEAAIILSTWKNEEVNEGFERFAKLGIDVILSEPPESPGLLNVNYQLLSTAAGIEKARELGREYVFKTRTDFRFYANDLISLMHTLINRFPLKHSSRKQTKRLVVLPPVQLEKRMYYLPDFLMYGTSEDMSHFWSVDQLLTEEMNGMNPEMLLFARYAMYTDNYVLPLYENMQEYVDMICNNYVIIDESMCKSIWMKYTHEKKFMTNYKRNTINFTDWLNKQ